MKRAEIVNAVKNIVHQVAPDATAILYGSEARGEAHADSDIDVLVLLNKEKVTLHDRQQITHPLYDVEFETGVIISPKIFPKQLWENEMSVTPFYHNVKKEGVLL
jgi:predicted nucleotidyltransferase